MKKQISIPKEKAPGERRVIMTPKEIPLFQQAGYKILVEKGAGNGIGVTDDSYRSAGAHIVDTETVWGDSDIIYKYKPPTEKEFSYLDANKTLCAVFHAEGNPTLTTQLKETGCTAYSYEFFQTPEGYFPLSVISSEIAGQVSILYGAYHLQTHLGGSGVLLAPVPNSPPPKVVVIGHGNAGGAAARLASTLGAEVTVLGRNRERLRAFQATMPQGTKCLMNTPKVLSQEIPRADLVIGAILISTYDTPVIIDESLVRSMKEGSMIIDVTAGYGPGFLETFSSPTNFENPVYKKFGVLHCKIDVLPLAYAQTTTYAMSQHIAPYLLELANALSAGESNPTAEAGKIVENGNITHPEVKRHMDFWNNAHE